LPAGGVMDLFTEFVRRLTAEVGPIWKWANNHWPVVLICLIAAILLVRHRNKRKS